MVTADLASFKGIDPAFLRSRQLTDQGVQIKLQEDQSRDKETDHIKESVNYFAFAGDGPLTARSMLLMATEQPDRFVFTSNDLIDGEWRIEGFDAAQGDKLDIADLLIHYDPGADGFVSFEQFGNDTRLEIDRDGPGANHGWETLAVIAQETGLDTSILLMV